MPILLRAASGFAAEIVAEEGWAGEVVLIRKVGERDVRLEQVEAYLHDGVDVDGFFRRTSVVLLHDIGQVAGGDAEFVGSGEDGKLEFMLNSTMLLSTMKKTL